MQTSSLLAFLGSGVPRSNGVNALPVEGDAHRIGAALRVALAEPGSPAIRRGVGWTTGLCYVLAEALVGWLGGKASLAVIEDREGRVQHVVAVAGRNLLLDGEGAWTAPELVRRWDQFDDVYLPRLVPWDPQRHPDLCKACRVYAPRGAVSATQALLSRQLGVPARWGLGGGGPAR